MNMDLEDRKRSIIPQFFNKRGGADFKGIIMNYKPYDIPLKIFQYSVCQEYSLI
jgi:hypothetical protein